MIHLPLPRPFAALTTVLMLVTLAQAQPTLNSSDLPQGGQTYERASAAPPLFAGDLDAGGADLEWDFSDLVSTGIQDVPYFPMGAASITTQFVFSSADHFTAFEIPDLGIENPLPISGATTYHEFGSNAYRIIGLGITTDVFDLPVIYDDDEELLPLPLTFGATLDGTSAFQVDLPGILYYGTEQSHTIEVDAWGTLLLPGGEYECLRVRRTFSAQDTINVAAAGIGFSLPREGTVYEWYAAGEGMPVLSVQSLAGIPGVWQYKPGEEVNGTPDIAPTDMAIAPNPLQAGADLCIRSNAARDGRMRIVDAAGRVMFTGRVEWMEGQARISTADWPAGVYHATFEGGAPIRFVIN